MECDSNYIFCWSLSRLSGDKKETTRKLMSIPSSTLSKIDQLLFGPPRLKPISGSSKNVKDLRTPSGLGSRLKLFMNVSPRIKSHPVVKECSNEIDNNYTSSPKCSLFLRYTLPHFDKHVKPSINYVRDLGEGVLRFVTWERG